MQAVVNAYILFQKWVRLTIICVDDRIVGMKSRGENPTTQVKIKAQLDYLSKITMLCWIEAIADHLMSQCQIGREEAAGGRSKKRRWDTVDGTPGKWFGNRFKGPSRCFNRTGDVRFCDKNTRGVCGCNRCRGGEKGGLTRTRICLTCCESPVAHERASIFANSKGNGGKYKCRLVALSD